MDGRHGGAGRLDAGPECPALGLDGQVGDGKSPQTLVDRLPYVVGEADNGEADNAAGHGLGGAQSVVDVLGRAPHGGDVSVQSLVELRVQVVATTLEPDNLAVRRLLSYSGAFELLLGLGKIRLDGVQPRPELHACVVLVVCSGLALLEICLEPRRFDRQLCHLCRQV